MSVSTTMFAHPRYFTAPVSGGLRMTTRTCSPRMLRVTRRRGSAPGFRHTGDVAFSSERLVCVSNATTVQKRRDLAKMNLRERLRVAVRGVTRLAKSTRLGLLHMCLGSGSRCRRTCGLLGNCRLGVPVSCVYTSMYESRLLVRVRNVTVGWTAPSSRWVG